MALFLNNKTIYNLYNGLLAIKSSVFQARTSFAIVRNINTLKAIVEDIYKVRDEIVMRYGEKSEDNSGSFTISTDKMSIFQQEIENLENAEVEINLCKIKWSDIENLNISVQDMETLAIILEEEN